MSIFNDLSDLAKFNDEIIERYYTLNWDYVEGRRIKYKLSKKNDNLSNEDPLLYKNTYYYPLWVFKTLYAQTISDIRYNGKEISGKNVKIVLTKLDMQNMRHRFDKIIKQCGKFKYKGDTFINMNYHDMTWDSVRNQILTMMYNYISKETRNFKYFKKKK